MPGESDALTGRLSERALDALEVFTRHGGYNEEDLVGWRSFIAFCFIDGRRADRADLRRHLRETRPEDSEEWTEDFLDEYENSLRLLETYVRLADEE